VFVGLPPLFIESNVPGSASVAHTSMMRADDVICRLDDLGLPQFLSDPRANCIRRDLF
jgi:hypothetical protein